jgi:hypothetical protein
MNDRSPLDPAADEANAGDKGSTERVHRGLRPGRARPGHLGHPERPIHAFATRLASHVG